MVEGTQSLGGGPRRRIAPTGTIARLRRPLATLLLICLLGHWTLPAIAETTGKVSSTGSSQRTTGSAAPKSSTRSSAPSPPEKGAAPDAAVASMSAAPDGGGSPVLTTFSIEAFQTDLFTGAATAEVPIIVPPGTAGVAPKLVLRYNSGTVDELDKRQQAPWTGLGWTLDVGGLIVRDPKGTGDLTDDTLKLVFGGASHDLVLVDASQWLYRTKDETFWKIQYDGSTDAWSLWTKDGTVHRFGASSDSRAIAYYPDLQTPYVYKYLLNEVARPDGLAVRYAYYRYQSVSTQTGLTYTQAVYPSEITYTYAQGSPIGSLRKVSFLRVARTDADLLGTADFNFFERERLYAIEVQVGTSLVRRYDLVHDYSIDRDPSYTWSGGAAGDLTLTSVTQIGTDNVTALPAVTFTYADARLAGAANGLGGIISYGYDRIATVPIYADFMRQSDDPPGCYDATLSTGTSANCAAYRTVFGHAFAASRDGTVPFYAVCKWYDAEYSYCLDHGIAGSPGPNWPGAAPMLLGYLLGASAPGTQAVWSNYTTYVGTSDPDGILCKDLGGATTGALPGGCTPQPGYGSPTFLGHLYTAKLDRARVVSRTVSDGRGGAPSVTHYAYGTPGIASTGEFRGHDWVRTTDPAGHLADTWFHQDDALRGRIARVETRSATGALYTAADNTWTTTNPAPGVTFAALSQTKTTTCDGNATCKQAAQAFTYGDYGNRTAVTYEGDLAVTGDERTEVTEYALNPSAYLVGLPKTTKTLDSTGATVAQTWFLYDGATDQNTAPTLGRLARTCRWLDGGPNPCVTMTHDEYGNVATVTDARGNTTTTTYDTAYHSFPATVTTPPTPNAPGGLTTTFTYDARFGVVLTVTDPNASTPTHTYAYDKFGRRTTVTNLLDEVQETSYEGFGAVGTQRITTTLPGGLWSRSYFDGVGRVFRIEKAAPGGQTVVLETDHDPRGLVARTSLPRFSGDPLWTTFTYDPLGRPLQTTYPDGTTESVSYDDWIVTHTDRLGRVRTSEKDAYGRTVQVVEPGESGGSGPVTRYGYNAQGLLALVTDTAGSLTTILYDTLGRKSTMTEPNMGTWSYTYDPNGNLISQTDAKGQTLTFTYDTLNRLVAKSYPGGESRVALTPSVKSWTIPDLLAYAGSICVSDGTGCLGTDLVLGGSAGTPAGYLGGAPAADTVPVYGALCYGDAGGVCARWGLGLEANGPQLGFAATVNPGSGVAFGQSGGLLLSGLAGSPTIYLAASAGAGTPRTDHMYTVDGSVPSGYTGEAVGIYVRQGAGASSAPLMRYVHATTGSHYYSVSGDPPAGYQSDSVVGHLETTAGEGRVPLYRHHQAATGDYLLSTAETPPAGYVAQGVLGYGYTQGSTTPAAASVTYVYDLGTNGKGRRSSMTDGGGTVTYAYDILGRPTTVTRTLDGHSYPTQTTYTALGRVATVTYADGEVVSYTYDAGQVVAVTGAAPYASGIQYNAAGQVVQLQYGNGVIRTHAYDPATLRLAGLTTQISQGAVFQQFAYTYDHVGNLTVLTDQRDGSHTQTFTYDALNRLRTAASGAYGTQSYTYSDTGNLLSKGPAASPVTYTYGAAAQTCGRPMPHAVTATSDGKSYTYDCNGNLLTDGSRNIVWDADNKPVSITLGTATTTFTYSGDGARLKKVGINGTIRYAGGLEDHVTDGVQLKSIAVAGLAVATRVVGGPHAGVYYTHGDHLGSLNVLTNGAAAEIQRLTYRPFGATHTNTGSVDFATRRYTNQLEDPETGLYFYNARYYNPVLGRFLSPDSIVPEPGTPQSLNRYSYVENNPVTRIDPSGQSWLSSFAKPILQVAIQIGMVAGSIVAGAFQQYWAIPLIMGAGNASLSALGGGTGSQVARAAMAGLATSIVGMGVGAGAGALPLEGIAGRVTTAALVGAAVGATGSALVGGNVLRGALNGAISAAVIAAVVAGLAQVPSSSPVLEPAGGSAVRNQDSAIPWAGEVPDDLRNMTLPTDRIRGTDPWGSGYFGAGRGNPLGWHSGTDFAGEVGQEVPLPFAGQRVAFGSGYDRGVQVTHSSGLFRAILQHIDPTTMGILAPPWAKMTPHVHFQLEQNLSEVWYRVDPLSVIGQ